MANKIVNRGIKIWLDGKEVERNVNAIRNEMRSLIKDQAKMTIGAEDYVRSGKKIAYLNSILNEHRQNTAQLSKEYKSLTQRAKEAFGSVSSWFNRNLAVTGTIIASITGASLAFRRLAEDVAKMDDIYSDVMKTTGMTRSEVVAMNNEFKKIDTRTSREELNKIAEAGGRIGIAKENIVEFTRSMNIANVALGDSFTGGVEEISTKLGKLKMLFQETKDMQVEKAYLSIGSSINELGAKGAASEPNIANFALRVGSLPDALKPSIAETLALGAAFEESGIEAEISSRAYNIFLKQAATETEKFAKVMRLPVDEVENMINTKPMDFFLQFAEGMRGMDATQTAKTLEYLGVNADGANKAIGAAANNTARFRELVDLSNKSFEEGTSVVNEYNIKNSNLAAELEKARKGFKETALELGERLNPVLLKSTKGTTYLIRSMIELPKWLRENKGLILILAIVIGNYTLAVNKARIALLLKNTQLKLSTFFLAANRAANLAAAAAQALFTGNITRARIAMQVFNKSMLLNPYVLLGTAIAAVSISVYKLATGFNKLKSEAEIIIDINKKVADSLGRERGEVELLIAISRNEKIAKFERINALTKLNEISPEYLGNLNIENINTNAVKVALEKYTQALRENAMQKAISDRVGELYAKQLEREAKIAENNAYLERLRSGGGSGSEMFRIMNNRNIKLQNEISTIETQISVYTKLGQTLLENKKISNDSEFAKILQLEKEQKLLEDLESQQSALYQKSRPSGVLKDSQDPEWGGQSDFADKAQFNLLTQRIERQREIVKAKKEELELSKKITKTEEVLDFWTPDDKNKPDTNDTIKSKDPKFKKDLDALKEKQKTEILSVKQSLLEKNALEDEFREQTFNKEMEHLDEIRQLYIDNGVDSVDIDMQITDKMIAESNRRYSELKDAEKKNQDELADIRKDAEETAKKEEDQRIKDLIDKRNTIVDDVADGHKDMIEELYELNLEWLNGFLDQYGVIASRMAEAGANIIATAVNFAQVEEMAVERKYDKQIKAARKAGKDTTKLEEKKEEEIAKIRAKSADKQFILTVAGVISSTAMAAINSFASASKWGGPIAGGIAAAAATAYGLSQIAIAREQHKAAKEGYYLGGFTGGNDPREVRGYFPDGQPYHGNEFVVNHRGVNNPNIRPVLNAFDMAQRTGTINSMSKQDIAKALNINTANVVSPSGNNPARDAYVYDTIDRLSRTVERLSNQIDEGIPAIATISGEKGIAKKLDEFNKLTKHARG